MRKKSVKGLLYMKTIYYHADLFGADAAADAFAVHDGIFAQVGRSEDLLADAAPDDVLCDLHGQFVTPGFNDSHMHLLGFGARLSGCSLEGIRSIADLQNALAEYIRVVNPAPDCWIEGRGWNEDYFPENESTPVRQDLDKVCSDRPVCLTRCCGHCLVANTRALEIAGIDEHTPQPDGGRFELGADGKPNGIFRDGAMGLIRSKIPLPDRNALRQMLKKAMQQLNQAGVTSCQTDDFCTFAGLDWRDVVAAFHELEAAGEMTVRVYEQCHFTTADGIRQFISVGFSTGVGSNLFKIGPVKLMADGSLGARTARLRDGYADAPGEKGLLIYPQQQLEEMIAAAHQGGMQVAVHAIGDEALDRVLDGWEKAFAACPRDDHRSGVVHLQITHPEQLERLRKDNLIGYIQPVFLDYDARIAAVRAGKDVAATSYAFETMRRMGIPVSSGTDCPVENPLPMRGVQCAVTRQPLDGGVPPFNPGEAMTVADALESYTAAGAYASFEEKVKGRIQQGMLADFTVWSGSPFDVAPDKIAEIVAKEVCFGGKIVYRAEDVNGQI